MNISKDKPATGSVNEDKNAKEGTANAEAKDNSKDDSKSNKRSAEQKAISAEVLALTNDFNAFSANCAFLCEAFAAIASDQSSMDAYIVYGFNRYGLWIKEQVTNFDERIEKLQEHIREQH
ncbi:hypothetical protein [Thalassomonas haliotis]|uniref:DUF3144 domain-containing protein n=1 Tax=Thalassomonas haliotis TaxID=485448 RepID=A0ABY7VC09_9GAMM|nr:hypothetical protein [Thalassomonas haliotis]WDE10871.1 hypothetical protein H3N35_21890 [Thalassomonas haliotis]